MEYFLIWVGLRRGDCPAWFLLCLLSYHYPLYGHLAVCIAVSEFFDTTRRLPKRQVGDSDEKRAEDVLARRWDRLMAEKASVSKELLSMLHARKWC